MEHLNYCRRMVRDFNALLAEPTAHTPNSPVDMTLCIKLAGLSRKFLLPEGGLLLDDKELRALDESGTLNLPFPEIALEFATPDTMGSRTIVFARERGEVIELTRATCVEGFGWIVLNHSRDGGGLLRSGYLDRHSAPHGMPTIKLRNNSGEYAELDEPIGDTYVLLSFLNALSCSNVSIEESQPRKLNKAPKHALPFDSYHILTIDTGECGVEMPKGVGETHRSPREHLRRGHIRRLAAGRRIWVNAAVIAAGRGVGVVSKDYALMRRGST